jgi:hypothetical protein
LYKVTGEEKRLVSKWRVRTLFRVREDNGKIETLENLLRKFKDLRPNLITQVG